MSESDDRGDRLALLLALEISRIVRDLDERAEFLTTVWSRHRTRVPFSDTVYSRWRTLQLTDLLDLPKEALLAVDTFYDELESFRLYLAYTEDMPTTLSDVYALRLRRLRLRAQPALAALGGPPERPAPLGPPTLLTNPDEAAG